MLILAGGGAYYFAKRSINADRAERAATIERERQYVQRLREQEYAATNSRPASASTSSKKERIGEIPSRDPSSQVTSDPAPVTHAQQDMAAKGKYEAAEPFRSRKGDRFS